MIKCLNKSFICTSVRQISVVYTNTTYPLRLFPVAKTDNKTNKARTKRPDRSIAMPWIVQD